MRDQPHSLGLFCIWFPFGMYAYVCLYLHCIALSSAITAQQFWKDDEFCQNLNTKHDVKRNLVSVKNENITCTNFNNLQPNKGNINVLNNVRLLCREFNSLTYAWNHNTKNLTNHRGVTIIVEFMSYNTPDIHLIAEEHQTNVSYIRIGNLKPNTEYAARFRTLINGTVHHTTDVPIQMTLDNGRNPYPVYDIKRVTEFFPMKNSASAASNQTNLLVYSTLTWMPSTDMNCYYKIIINPNWMEIPTKYYIDYAKTGSYAITLTGLKTDSDYTVSIQSYYNKTSPVIASIKTIFKFSTPRCLNFSHYNWYICAPGDPYEVNVTETIVRGDGRYDAGISWKIINVGGQGIDYFHVKLGDEAKNVSNTINSVYFKNVLLGDFYFASVQAFSRVGHSKETIVHKQRRVEYAEVLGDYRDRRDYYFYLWSVVLMASVFCTVLVIGKQVHRRMMAGNDGVTDASRYDMVVLKNLNDVHMMLDREDVTVSDVYLGHGHFGVVRKGALQMENGGECPVAIKSLRDRPNSRDLEVFLGEILLMQKVGKHPNIVSMIGCYQDVNKRCLLVVEYCPLGDLQTYLRKVSVKSWYTNDIYVVRADPVELNVTVVADYGKEVELLDSENRPTTPTSTADVAPPMVFNNCYLYHGEDNVFLTVEDLMRFARQAANGMEFLEKNRIVHRDLAARNVLLSDHHTIKIGDFGLSRDVYEQNLYQKSNCGEPLPIKWMALESLKYRVYTTQSDVWSFGVLLWEIMMLGECPYPTISSSQIYEVLCKGYRMPRPPLCCFSLYDVMLVCWDANPANRPKFGSIKDTIDDIMGIQYS